MAVSGPTTADLRATPVELVSDEELQTLSHEEAPVVDDEQHDWDWSEE